MAASFVPNVPTVFASSFVCVVALVLTRRWRRDGVFLSTIAFADDRDPPRLLPGGADLAGAEPLHSWVDQPVV